MSVASRTGEIIYRFKSGTYTPILNCDKGDLYQEFDGDAEDPINIAPDFTTLKPTYSFVVTSSRVAEGEVVPSHVEWYFNDVKLSFTGNISTNVFGGETGHFKQIPYSGGANEYYGLQIVKNLVKASSGASCTIACRATVVIGNTSDEVGAMRAIPITKGVGNQKRVTIMADDDNYFSIREKGGSCKMKAVVMQGSGEITSGLAYKWYKLSNGTWSLLSGQTSKSLTVTNDMVDSAAVFKVEVTQNGASVGMDTQKVNDLSDPYDILANPVPEDETIESGSGGTVKYTPMLVKRGSTTKAKDMTFYFTFTDSAGNILNPSTSGVASASGTCTEAMCQQAGGNVGYTIETSE